MRYHVLIASLALGIFGSPTANEVGTYEPQCMQNKETVESC